MLEGILWNAVPLTKSVLYRKNKVDAFEIVLRKYYFSR